MGQIRGRFTEELRAGTLWSIAELPADQIPDRQLLRTTEQMARTREDFVRRTRSLCLQHSLDAPWHARKPGRMTKADLAWVRTVETGSPAVDQALRALGETHDFFAATVDELWAQLEELVRAKRTAEYEALTSIPGIGRKTAITWLLELPPLTSFRNADAFISWLGLAVREHSSGESVRRGGVGRTGNTAVRRVLLQVALTVGRQDPTLSQFARRLRPRLHANQVKVAVAAKLARRLFAMMKAGAAYSPPELDAA